MSRRSVELGNHCPRFFQRYEIRCGATSVSYISLASTVDSASSFVSRRFIVRLLSSICVIRSLSNCISTRISRNNSNRHYFPFLRVLVRDGSVLRRFVAPVGARPGKVRRNPRPWLRLLWRVQVGCALRTFRLSNAGKFFPGRICRSRTKSMKTLGVEIRY